MSKYFFKFNSAEYEFDLLYQTIKNYYPSVHAPNNNEEDAVDDCLDNEVIGQLTYDNVGVARNYKTRWQPFARFLRQKLKQPVNGTIFLSNPCFQGYLIVEKITGQDYELSKELHFAISLLGPYYTIYGIDASMRKLQMRDDSSADYGYCRATHAVTVSPSFEYENKFLRLKSAIATWFPDYKFVPFAINEMQLPGLCAYMSEIGGNVSDRVHSALFNDNLDFSVPTRGDSHYGYDEWRIPETLTAEDHVNAERIAEHIQQNRQSPTAQAATIHRVWKYKSSEYLPPFLKANEIGMISIETFDLLDLTDILLARYTAPRKAKVHCYSYQILGDELLIDAPFNSKFKIAHVAADELRIVLIIDITAENKIIRGEACEIVFGLPE